MLCSGFWEKPTKLLPEFYHLTDFALSSGISNKASYIQQCREGWPRVNPPHRVYQQAGLEKRQHLLGGSPWQPLKGTWHGSWPPKHDLAANSN